VVEYPSLARFGGRSGALISIFGSLTIEHCYTVQSILERDVVLEALDVQVEEKQNP